MRMTLPGLVALSTALGCGTLLLASDADPAKVVDGGVEVPDGAGDAATPVTPVTPLRHCGAKVLSIDFEDGGAPVLPGQADVLQEGGTLDYIPAPFGSKAMRATVTATADNPGAAFLVVPTAELQPGAGYCARLDFRMYVTGAMSSDLFGPSLALLGLPAQAAQSVQVVLTAAARDPLVGLVVRPPAISIYQNGVGAAPSQVKVGSVELDQWLHITVFLSTRAGENTVELSIDKVDGSLTVSDRIPLVVKMDPADPAQLGALIGIIRGYSTPNVYIDDVSVEFVQP